MSVHDDPRQGVHYELKLNTPSDTTNLRLEADLLQCHVEGKDAGDHDVELIGKYLDRLNQLLDKHPAFYLVRLNPKGLMSTKRRVATTASRRWINSCASPLPSIGRCARARAQGSTRPAPATHGMDIPSTTMRKHCPGRRVNASA
jgi:hypothetical protein